MKVLCNDLKGQGAGQIVVDILDRVLHQPVLQARCLDRILPHILHQIADGRLEGKDVRAVSYTHLA